MTLLSLSVNGQNKYPDFRHVCGDGFGNNINLSWSPLSDTCGKFDTLYIYGSIDALQPFTLIDKISNLASTQYTHFGAKNISTTWNYYLVYKSLCNGDSAISDTLAIDNTQPPSSEIDSVSVDINTGKVIIGWSKNPAPDVMNYTIWRALGANNVPIDTIDSTFYIHPTSNPNSGALAYTLTAIDSCLNQSIIQSSHTTMFLRSVYDTCNKSITINWTAYFGWANILGYDIYIKNGQSPFIKLQTNNPSNLSYTFTNFIQGDTLEFYIQAREGNKGFTSSSNKITITTRGRKYSKRNYISYASVLDSTSVEIKLLCDTASDTKKYTLYRKKQDEGYIKLTDLIYDGSSLDITYIDNNTQNFLTNYQYRFISSDKCGVNLDTSNIAKTMFLSVESNNNGNNIKFNRYSLWNAGVDRFNIYRGFDFSNGFTWNIVNTLNNTDSLYSDINFPDDVGLAGTCYYIEAQEGIGNIYGEQSKSKSNTVCLVEDAVIHFPNAFAPGKVNTLFLPKGVNIDYKRTSMLIYARNGQFIKKIDDIRNGWDGTNQNGDMCLDGVYLYICELFGLNEKKYNFKGTVHLLR